MWLSLLTYCSSVAARKQSKASRNCGKKSTGNDTKSGLLVDMSKMGLMEVLVLGGRGLSWCLIKGLARIRWGLCCPCHKAEDCWMLSTTNTFSLI
jgi:hypothetical protein